MLWNATVVSMVLSGLLALVLAMRIEKHYPDLRAVVDFPGLMGWWPFLVFHFFSPRKLRMLSPGDRLMAVASLVLLCLALSSLAYIVFCFIRSGATI